MKKFLILIPIIIGGVLLAGCASDTTVVATTPGASYGDPYYVSGGVQYYSESGRYYYFRDNQRFYVDSLPGGGTYPHGHGHGGNVTNNTTNETNVNVTKEKNVNVNKNVAVNNTKNVKKPAKTNLKEKKPKKDDSDQNTGH